MSTRRFNYTHRIKVERKDVHCVLERRNDGLAFSADIHLSDYQLPTDAEVFLEAARGIERVRFPWGTVGRLEAPAERSLKRFGSDDGIGFRLVVSGRTTSGAEGLIAAEANNIKPELDLGDARGGRSLLPVAVEPTLGQTLWRIDFQGSGPVLQVNPALGGKAWCATTEFRSAVLSSCVRQVLLHVVLSAMPPWPVESPDDQDWGSLWLWFAKELPGAPALPEDRSTYEDIVDWLDDVVNAFNRHTAAMERWRDAQGRSEE